MALTEIVPPFVNRDRRFRFERDVDVSGVSGVGVVATGILFADGQAVVRWIVPDKPQSTVVYSSLHDAELIHGHDGKTRLVFDDNYEAAGFSAGRRQGLEEARDVARTLSRGGVTGQVQHAYREDVAGAIGRLLG
jgi:hypothetical protein